MLTIIIAPRIITNGLNMARLFVKIVPNCQQFKQN